MEEQKETKNWYDRNYKLLLIIPIAIFIVSLIVLFNFYQKNNDFIHKDVSLTGGTSITVFDGNYKIEDIKESLKKDFPDAQIRGISDIRTGKQKGFSAETQREAGELKKALEKILGYTLNSDNSSTEFSGASLSKGFYQQLQNSILAAFLLMGAVIFIIFGTSKRLKNISIMVNMIAISILFKNTGLLSNGSIFIFIVSFLLHFFGRYYKESRIKIFEILILALVGILFLKNGVFGKIFFIGDIFIVGAIILFLAVIYVKNSVPSVAVISAALADIIMTLAVVDYLEIQISAAGIVAFLMLIGYSVDTDILLTTRLLRNKDESVNKRLLGALKTGITMTLTAMVAIGACLVVIYSFSETLRQIFGIILIGLGFDIINTWITNASILKWYMEVKKIE